MILADFARVAAESTDLQRLLDLACHNAARAIGVEHCKVMRYRPEKGDLLIVAGKGWKPGVVGHARLGTDMMSPAGRSYQTRANVVVESIQDDPSFRYSSVLRDHGLVSLLNAPIAINGVVWGVIEVDSSRLAAFDEDDSRFLLAFALILALAVRHRNAQAARERDAEQTARGVMQAQTLLSEQNHRIRNYFQMILAILASRAQRADSSQLRTDYQEVMERVTAIALAHDQLTFKEGQTHVNVSDYLDALCGSLERMETERLRVERQIEPVAIRPNRAVPLGLILNELLTNAVKYAAGPAKDAVVSVRFEADTGTGDAVLVVQDNGPGMGEGRPGSQGLRLVRLLAGQLSGRVDIDSSPSGTAVTLTFPLVE
jgi:two-component sensor histidine kinase